MSFAASGDEVTTLMDPRNSSYQITEKAKIKNGLITIGGSPKASEPIPEVAVGMTDHTSSPVHKESPPSFERKRPMMMAYREAALSHRHMQK